MNKLTQLNPSSRTQQVAADKQYVTATVAVRLPAMKVATALLGDSLHAGYRKSFYKQLLGWIETAKRPTLERGILLLAARTERQRFPMRGPEPGKIQTALVDAVAQMPAWPQVQCVVDRQPSEVYATQIYGIKIPSEAAATLLEGVCQVHELIRTSEIFDATTRELCYALLLQVQWQRLTEELTRGVGDKADDRLQQFRQQIAERLAGDNLDAVAQKATTLRHQFHAALAQNIEPLVNAYIASHSQRTDDQKQKLALGLNETLRELGLAMRCPNTGAPSILTVDRRASESNLSSRFEFRARQQEGRRKRTASTVELKTVELMEDVPRKEGLVDWVKQSAGESTGKTKRTR